MFLATTNSTQNLVPRTEVRDETVITAQMEAATSSEIVVSKKAEVSVSPEKTNDHVQATVKEYFKDTPLMIQIARCESTYRQYNADGTPFRGIVNNKDVGVMQINEHYHLARSKKLGMDIHTLEGNLAYGKLLFKEQGGQPWSASRPCWGKSAVVATAAPAI